jgi:ABC-type multidrug transport system ATPase subunit
MDELVVTTQGLTKRYGDRLAVDGVSMTVRRGEVYGFLGPNGAGKTTTLRMALGLVRPTAGSVRILGEAAGSPLVTARVGALIEGPGFYPSLSGRDNLRVLARYRGLPEAAADDALARVELADRGSDRFRSYSLGMKQRLGVAAALMGSPELIVLDEPTNGLDPAGMVEMRALIVDLARGGQTVVLSSHLLAEVQDICDRVGVIHRGRLLSESTVAELRGGSTLRVRGVPLDRTLATASRVAGDEVVRLEGDHVVVTSGTDAPGLVRALVADGVDVHEVTTAERTLEEVFFEMTAHELEAV